MRDPYKPGELVYEPDGLTWHVRRGKGGTVVAQFDREEDARLFCAAPGMLEALLGLRAHLDEPRLTIMDVYSWTAKHVGPAIAAAERGEGSDA